MNGYYLSIAIINTNTNDFTDNSVIKDKTLSFSYGNPFEGTKSHGIYMTMYAEYKFAFTEEDNTDKSLWNVQDDFDDSGNIAGYLHSFDINVESLISYLDPLDQEAGIHFDLYHKTDGVVDIFAPFSHDAVFDFEPPPPNTNPIPEPQTLFLFGAGFISMLFYRKRRRRVM